MVIGVCVSSRPSVIFMIRWSILCMLLMCGAISWCIAIATPSMCFPGMSRSGFSSGLVFLMSLLSCIHLLCGSCYAEYVFLV